MSRKLTIDVEAAADLLQARRWLRQPGAGGRAAARLRDLQVALKDLRHHP